MVSSSGVSAFGSLSTSPLEERSEGRDGLQEVFLLPDNYFTNLHVVCIIEPEAKSGKEVASAWQRSTIPLSWPTMNRS